MIQDAYIHTFRKQSSKLFRIGLFAAILAAGAPEHAAFMADESMAALPGLQPIKYDLPFYKDYMKQVSTLMKQLNKEGN